MAVASKTQAKNYYYAVGRRKSSTSVVKLYPKWKGQIYIISWEKKYTLEDYFGGHYYLRENAVYPLTVLGEEVYNNYNLEIKIKWGWLRGQADAIRLGVARALVEGNPEFRQTLKPYWFLKRDPREKERKKPGKLKARKEPEWSKR